jgi:hypothetical protein
MFPLDIFPIPLFPQGSLSSSITTTVWVGIFVVAYFNLRLGWVLSGLVVPGYLVPLFILNPWSAVIIIIEAIITYFVILVISEYLSRLGYWCSVFGRDRFLAIVLASVLVRVILDGWLLEKIGQQVIEFVHNYYGYELVFDYHDKLHSFGLIIVALMANQFWKTGVIRGLIPLFSSLLLTGMIVFMLMELTNFSISNLNYMYEDLAISILSAPKAYIIVIVTAFIASRMNLHYNWDFNGILIPALLALQWYQPHKILLSFVEAFFILIVAKGILAIPLLKAMSIEGARKLLLFFNIGFFYKMGLGYFLLWFMPTVKVTDYYAFGYLLSTLIAMKMYDKQIAIRMTGGILITSLSGIFVASFLGLFITLLPWDSPSNQTETVVEEVQMKSEKQTLMVLIHQDKIDLYQGMVSNGYVEPTVEEINHFKKGLKYLLKYQEQKEKALLQQAANYFAQVHYETLLVQERYIYLRESSKKKRGRGFYVLDLEADIDANILVEVPTPLDEWGMMEAGYILFRQMQGNALAIAGSAQNAKRNNTSNMLINQHSFFQTFHRELVRHNVLQVRATYTKKNQWALSKIESVKENQLSDLPSSLWIKGILPPGLELSRLERLIGGYIIEWATPHFRNAQRDFTSTGFTELFLNEEDVFKLLFSPIKNPIVFFKKEEENQGRQNQAGLNQEKQNQEEQNQEGQNIEGYLQTWLNGKTQFAPKGSDLYKPPQLEELLFFDKELLTPLLKLIRNQYHTDHWRKAGLEGLQVLAKAANIIGYEIELYQDQQANYLILKEQSEDRRYWGTYVFRLGVGKNYLIQVPRPIYEINSFEYAVTLFARLQAKVLLIAGTHPLTNRDRSSDLVLYRNLRSIFNAVNQVTLRELGEDEQKDEAMLVIQIRTMARRHDGLLPEADLLLAFDKGMSSEKNLCSLSKTLFTFKKGIVPENNLCQLAKNFVHLLNEKHEKIEFVHGKAFTAGYEVGHLPQVLYLPATQNKEFVILWLSPSIHQFYRKQKEANIQGIQFNALNIPTVKKTLHEYIMSRPVGKTEQIAQTFREMLKRYIQKQDILILQDLLNYWPQYRLERFIDINSKQAFLLIFIEKEKISLIANLLPRHPDSRHQFSPIESQKTVARFIENRTAWLEF